MAITHSIENELCTIAISGEMSVYTARLMQETLLELLQSENKIKLDLSDIHEIDSAGIQILISLKKYALDKKISLQFYQHSQCLLDAIDLFNLSNELGGSLIMINSQLSE